MGASMITPPPVGTFPHPPSKPRPRNSAAVKVQSGQVVRRRPQVSIHNFFITNLYVLFAPSMQTAPTKSHRYESSPSRKTGETSVSVFTIPLPVYVYIHVLTLLVIIFICFCFPESNSRGDTSFSWESQHWSGHEEKTKENKGISFAENRIRPDTDRGCDSAAGTRLYSNTCSQRTTHTWRCIENTCHLHNVLLLCVLYPCADSFSFRSIRYSGMPYALVLYTGGMIDCRVSVCCEYRHRPGTLLGGKSAHFKVVSVKGGSPCYK